MMCPYKSLIIFLCSLGALLATYFAMNAEPAPTEGVKRSEKPLPARYSPSWWAKSLGVLLLVILHVDILLGNGLALKACRDVSTHLAGVITNIR